jgi:uncharacterized protein YdaU (DUF1376 family)
MHFYKKNIGDYAKKTGRLTILQHGAYTLLMDACYDRERFPTLEEAIEWTWALSADEVAAVEFVLKRFFTLEDGIYVQNRIREEIIEYNGKSLKNKEIAIEREAKRKQESTKRARTVNESPPNHKPQTINHEPITNSQEPHTHTETIQTSKPSMAAAVCVLLKAEGIGSVNPQNPTLTTLIDQGASIGLFAEAARIAKEKQKGFAYVLGVVDRQMQEAAAIAKQERANPSQATETPHERSMRLRYEEATGKRSSEARETIDITPRQTPKPELVRIA